MSPSEEKEVSQYVQVEDKLQDSQKGKISLNFGDFRQINIMPLSKLN